MIVSLLKEKNRENKEDFKVFLIKYITLSINKGIKTYSCKVLKMSCQNIISKLFFISIVDTWYINLLMMKKSLIVKTLVLILNKGLNT